MYSKLLKLNLIFLVLLFFVSCNNKTDKLVLEQNASKSEVSSKIDYKYYDIFNIEPVKIDNFNIILEPAKIIIPKNQTAAQSLSILVDDGHGNLIVFDGGRVEDADYLCDIIKDNGGIVKHWFITHIHDDHIGALYKILNDKRTDIVIENLFYDFADFNWYYEKMGNDAGIYFLFKNAINDYNNFLDEIKKKQIKISNVSKYEFSFYYKFEWFVKDENKWRDDISSKMSVKVLNNHYELDRDPINNTSITYMVELGKTKLFILGDLGYDGGNKLFTEIFKWKGTPYSDGSGYYDTDKYEPKGNFISGRECDNIDIIVLSHHGQNGIDPEHYKRFNPKVIIWPTSKDIYENTHGRYYTDDTKKALSEIKSIKYQIKSYEETALIR